MSASQSPCSIFLDAMEHPRGPNSRSKQRVDINVSKSLLGNEVRLREQLFAWQKGSSSDLVLIPPLSTRACLTWGRQQREVQKDP